MPLDIDYLAGQQAIEKLQKILSSHPHGERAVIANDIIKLVDKIKVKYTKTVNDKIYLPKKVISKRVSDEDFFRELDEM